MLNPRTIDPAKALVKSRHHPSPPFGVGHVGGKPGARFLKRSVWGFRDFRLRGSGLCGSRGIGAAHGSPIAYLGAVEAKGAVERVAANTRFAKALRRFTEAHGSVQRRKRAYGAQRRFARHQLCGIDLDKPDDESYASYSSIVSDRPIRRTQRHLNPVRSEVGAILDIY